MKNFYILLLFLPLMLIGDQYSVPRKQIYAVQFENTARSPRARMIMLMESISNQINQLLPSGRLKHKPFSVSMSYKTFKENHLVSLQLTRKGNYRITVPDNIHSLEENPEALTVLVCWHILARMGMKPDAVPAIRNSWFVTGLVRRLQREFHPLKAPFSSYYPAAYTLTSIRRYPSLNSVVTVPIEPEDTTFRLLYEEYSELLLYICSKNGMFRAGMLQEMLDSPNKINETEYTKRFFIFVENRLKKAAQKKKELTPDLDKWFQNALNSVLNRNFLPASGASVEIQYEQALHFKSPLKKSNNKNDQKDNQMLSGDLEILLSSYDKLESPTRAASQMASRLLPVCRTASPDLFPSISKMYSALIQFGKAPGAKTIADVRTANHDFYAALEKNLLLEKFLEETEMQCVSPAARYRMTLALLEYRKHPQMPYLKKMAIFLDRTERNPHKP